MECLLPSRALLRYPPASSKEVLNRGQMLKSLNKKVPQGDNESSIGPEGLGRGPKLGLTCLSEGSLFYILGLSFPLKFLRSLPER